MAAHFATNFTASFFIAHFVAGFLSGMSLLVAIGAQNSFVLRQGLRREHLLPVALFCALSDALLIGVGIVGLGALIQASPTFLSVARYGGAVFLLCYGIFALRRAWQGEQMQVTASTALPLAAAMATCFGFTFLNPHVYLDTVVLLGALANQRGMPGRWIFGTGAASASLLWFSALAYCARFLVPLFRRQLAWRVLDSIIGVTMLVMAAGLLAG
jgi:L-lysine exporter family protein LysE/ArgO